jgi:hypothetical protein
MQGISWLWWGRNSFSRRAVLHGFCLFLCLVCLFVYLFTYLFICLFNRYHTTCSHPCNVVVDCKYIIHCLLFYFHVSEVYHEYIRTVFDLLCSNLHWSSTVILCMYGINLGRRNLNKIFYVVHNGNMFLWVIQTFIIRLIRRKNIFLPHVRQFTFIRNRINKLVELRMCCFTSWLSHFC